ncbi:Major histocompatibility complex class I-related protein, partial [Ophiophagus hannah]
MAGKVALRSAPLLSLVWLAVAFPESSFGESPFKDTKDPARIQGICLTCFAISEPSQGLPHFVMLGHMDDHVLFRYDSESRKMQPQVSWIEKLQEDDSEFWDKVFKEVRDIENMLQYGLGIVRILSGYSEGLHMVQVIYSCDLQGDGSKRGFMHMAYNGESITPPSIMDKSDIEECKPPVVTVTRRVEAEDGKETHICRVHGFYPRAVNASWTRNGEVWLQDTLHGSVAPNADGTYHYWLSIQIDPEERGHYQCHVEHNSLQEPLDMALKGIAVWARYFFTSMSDSSQGLPHFVAVGYVDGQVFVHYDSHSRRVQPRVSWMEKVGKEDPQYWDTQTQVVLVNEELFRTNLEIQRGDGSKEGVWQHGYDGRAFLSFDKETLTWVAPDPQAQMSQRKLDTIPGYKHGKKAYLEEVCIEWLEKYLSYGRETLLRTEPPVVTVRGKTEVEDGMEMHVCHVDGFYPREIDASWRRDREVWLQDTFHGSVAPNLDGTYHYWLSIRIDPKERGHYRCHVEHDSLLEPLDVSLKGERLQGGKGWALAGWRVVGEESHSSCFQM